MSRRRLLPFLLALLAAAGWSSAAQAIELAPFPGSPLTVTTPSDVEVRDLDGTGGVEVAVASESANRTFVFVRDGGGGFVPAFSSLGIDAIRHIGFTDLLGDRLADLVYAGSASLSATMNFGASFGNSGTSWLAPGVTDAVAMEVADVMGTGRAQAIVLDRPSQTVQAYARNSSTAVWELRAQFATQSDPRDLAVGDFDGDDRPDVVVGADDGTRLTFAFGAEGGGFEPAFTLDPAGGGYGPWSVVAADFDGDGFDDVASTQRGAGSLTIMISDGRGGFTQAEDAVVGNGPDGLATGDLTGDGHADLATLPGYRAELVLTLGDGRGGFTRAHGTGTSTPGAPDVTLADLDGDGLDDVILRRHGAGTVELLRNVTRAAAATVPPTLSGTPAVGEQLTCDPGTWTGSEPLTTATAWLRDGAPIAGETGTAYVVAASDLGTRIACAVTGSNELPAVTETSAPLLVPSAPAATTGAATAVGIATATLHGVVDPMGSETTYRFEYGTTSAYGASTPAVTLGEDEPATAVSARLEGLAPDTTHHVRLVAENAVGTTHGADVTFTTSQEPPRPDPDPVPDPDGEPAPRPATPLDPLPLGPTHPLAPPPAPPVPPAPPAPPVPPAPPADTAPVVTVRSSSLRAARGIVPLRLTCAALEGEGRGACRGTVTLRSGGARPRTLASGRFDARAGSTATVRARLTAAGRRALAGGGRRGVRVRVVVKATDLAGNAATVSRRATLR